MKAAALAACGAALGAWLAMSAPAWAASPPSTAKAGPGSQGAPAAAPETDADAIAAIGAPVVNARGEQVGQLDDILLGRDNQPQDAVISVGGFLGGGTKLVLVPFRELRFRQSARGGGNGGSGKVMLPGATRDALRAMPEYRYAGGNG